MKKIELTAPCHFGLESVLKREVLDLGYEISSVEDGRVSFWGDAQAVAAVSYTHLVYKEWNHEKSTVYLQSKCRERAA